MKDPIREVAGYHKALKEYLLRQGNFNRVNKGGLQWKHFEEDKTVIGGIGPTAVQIIQQKMMFSKVPPNQVSVYCVRSARKKNL